MSEEPGIGAVCIVGLTCGGIYHKRRNNSEKWLPRKITLFWDGKEDCQAALRNRPSTGWVEVLLLALRWEASAAGFTRSIPTTCRVGNLPLFE